MSRRIFVSNHATGHVCSGASCPACSPGDLEALVRKLIDDEFGRITRHALNTHASVTVEAPLGPPRGIIGNSHTKRDDNVVVLPTRYLK